MGRKARAYLTASVITRVLIKIALVVLVIVAYVNAPTSSTLTDAATQRTRLELIVKDALILQYVPAGATQAFSEIQSSLPGWQAEEAELLAIPDSGIQAAVSAATSDYTQITAALRAIIARPGQPVDAIQVTIIRMHEGGYRSALNQIIMLIGLQVASQRSVAFIIVIGVTLFLIALCIGDVLVVRKSIHKEKTP